MNDEPTPFMGYWDAVDDALLKFFGIDTCDAGIEVDTIAEAEETGETPKEFARWFGENHNLQYLDDLKSLWRRR